MSGPEDPTPPDPGRAAPDAGPPRKLRAERIGQVVEEISVPALPEHIVMVNVGRPYRLEERLDGRVYRTFGVKGDVALIPAGTPTEFRSPSSEGQRVESLAISLDPSFVSRVAAEAGLDPDGVELIGTLGGRDPEIERIGAALMPEIGADDPFGDLYTDSLANLLAVHLLRHHSSLGRRVERARELLSKTSLPLHEVARLAGFADQSHLARHFRRHLGVTPRRFRTISA